MKKITILSLITLLALPHCLKAKQQYKAVEFKFIAPVSQTVSNAYIKSQKSQFGNRAFTLGNASDGRSTYQIKDISGIRIALLDMTINPDSGFVHSTRQMADYIKENLSSDFIVAEFHNGTQEEMKAVASRVPGLNVVICDNGDAPYSGFVMKEIDESDANPFFFINKDGSIDHPVSLSKTDSTLVLCPGNGQNNIAEAIVAFGISKKQIIGKVSYGNLIDTSNQPLENKFIKPTFKNEIADELNKQ